MIGKATCSMNHLLGVPYGAVFELDGNNLVRVDGELVEAEEEPPGVCEIERGTWGALANQQQRTVRVERGGGLEAESLHVWMTCSSPPNHIFMYVFV